ncbi:MAG: TIR domain-containing protein, partial [Chromatiaceae bacterium]|nr:TIR domain-containing protein [Chromatiaceae bacterium]
MTEFDVFLSHNSKDKPAVRKLARRLEARQIRVWLDEDQLIPGRNWQPLLEKAIERSATGAVLVGKDGAGPWQDEEMQALLDQAVREGKPVIPVLLPDAPNEPELPLFLRNRTWVDLRAGSSGEGIDRLIWGITGKKPESLRVGDESVQEATTPAQLWPADTLVTGAGEATECYARLNAICARGEVPASEERRSLWQAVKKDRPASFLAWQLATVARWGTPEYLEVDEHFTPLQVQVRVRERDEGPAEKQQLPFDTLAEAMTAVFEQQLAPASVIFAPPGGGKSTLLRHYQLQQARRLADSERLVLYLQLRDYRPDRLSEEDRGTNLPALAWLESEWRKEAGQAPPLAAFLRQGSLTLLLDGLNEIPRDSDDDYRARVGEWRDLVEAVDRHYPGVRLLFACRPLDYSQRLDAGRHTRLPEIEVQAMEPERIKAFIDKRFESPIAEQVWAQLEDRPALALYSSPYALNLLLGQLDTKAREIEIPQDRAALFSGMVRARLRRECQKESARFADPELMAARDRTLLMSGKPRAHWLPDDT